MRVQIQDNKIWLVPDTDFEEEYLERYLDGATFVCKAEQNVSLKYGVSCLRLDEQIRFGSDQK